MNTNAIATGERVQNRTDGATGTLVGRPDADIAIVQYDAMPYPTWAEWRDIA